MSGYLSVKEFAKRSGESEEMVRRALRNGKYLGAYKESDKAGWRIPFSYLDINNLDRNVDSKRNDSVNSASILGVDDEEMIILAYRIAFLSTPRIDMLDLLKSQGAKRALEIILTMRMNRKPINNPIGFVKNAIRDYYMPSDPVRKSPSEPKATTIMDAEKVSSKFKTSYYNWLDS